MIKWELFCNISTTSWCEQMAPSKLFLTRHLSMNNVWVLFCFIYLQFLNWDLHTRRLFMRIKSFGLNPTIHQTFVKTSVKQTSHLQFWTLYRGRVIEVTSSGLAGAHKAGSVDGWNISKKWWDPTEIIPGTSARAYPLLGHVLLLGKPSFPGGYTITKTVAIRNMTCRTTEDSRGLPGNTNKYKNVWTEFYITQPKTSFCSLSENTEESESWVFCSSEVRYF